MIEIALSDFGQKSTIPSPVNKMTESFALDFREGFDINLGVGYVNDLTIPTEHIKTALSYIIAHPKRYRNALNYGGAQGSPNLRKSIFDYYVRNNIGDLTESHLKNREIIIGANGATSILESFADIIKPGIVITSDPYYYIYCETLTRKGFKVISIPEDSSGIKTDLLRKKLETIDCSKLSFFYIVTINNPSCSILSNDKRKEIVSIANEYSKKAGSKIPVIFDRAYEDIIHSPNIEKPISGILFDSEELVFEIGTLSKIVAPALRIGYMIAPKCGFSNLIIQKTSDIGFSAPLINQEIASYILDNFIESQLEKVKKGYQTKAVQIKKHLIEQLGNNLEELIGGDAGFYFYITLRNVSTCENSAFFNFLSRKTGNKDADGFPEKKERLILIPGTCCVNPNGLITEKGNRQFRISFGFEDTTRILKAVDIIAEAIEFSKTIPLHGINKKN